MESQAGVVQTARDRVVAIPGWLPSLSSLAFLLPVVLLYWQLDGPSMLLENRLPGLDCHSLCEGGPKVVYEAILMACLGALNKRIETRVENLHGRLANAKHVCDPPEVGWPSPTVDDSE